jgi:hypothetical protein
MKYAALTEDQWRNIYYGIAAMESDINDLDQLLAKLRELGQEQMAVTLSGQLNKLWVASRKAQSDLLKYTSINIEVK